MRFTAKWSGLLIGVSVFASLILIFVSGLFFTRPDVPAGFKVAVIASCMGTLFTSLLFTVRGYRIEMGSLYIERLIWDTRIDLRHLRSVEADPDAMARAWRIFGNGGLFSFSGWFRNKQLGSFRALVTNRKDCVVVKLEDRTLVVSPSEPASFAEALGPRR